MSRHYSKAELRRFGIHEADIPEIQRLVDKQLKTPVEGPISAACREYWTSHGASEKPWKEDWWCGWSRFLAGRTLVDMMIREAPWIPVLTPYDPKVERDTITLSRRDTWTETCGSQRLR